MSDWQQYYHVYENTLLRWGDRASSRHSWEIFNEMFQRNSANIKLWLAINKDEVVVAGAIIFYAKKHVVYWHGAALGEYFCFRPVNLLFYEIIKNTCAKRYSWFDFNPSGGHEGVVRFKKSFGAKTVCYPIITITKSTKSMILLLSRLKDKLKSIVG